ncbi:OBERON-like protein [Zingiber officinale]|uniref:OBERON-like protein n=1 Tax=Zingiber officinale TaxID=94328 RepID=UPI001C4C9507|nr:OBERON-like protein [Zingiber officinale]XP_042413306.1 OBERON-like protein [Zingiber officinale]XP_042413307.1 OBERON-like protein [Zingiber officinale]XP_042413308.1 OBERON-like protein [Zingiber officinale]XP_042413309.1 OBERON-like protein [Zingiber officinale]XP_042413310.1 OBERON-like protein [Zingiber officinale]XP_042413311.1 OBERON-like protein [Zingiber officinale]XP_042413312.1 OBERON-like protein [Zingiber officinale]XP_042413313.1 OBERON-like protein [Zingiber officinale]
MGTSSGTNHHQEPPVSMLPPRQHPISAGVQASLSLASSDPAVSPDTQDPTSNSDQGQDFPAESASSGETWPIETNHSNGITGSKLGKEKEGVNRIPKLQVIRRSYSGNRLSLREVAQDRVEVICEKMRVMTDELLDALKHELRMILEGSGGVRHVDEFLYLQKLVHGRVDLTADSLANAHPVQLEILVAINTGVQAYLLQSVSIAPSRLVEVFFYKRCRNIACQSSLPAEECSCGICVSRSGFCNLCMCLICNKFDFEVNTCRWIGCDMCSHWTHTECAMRVGQIGTGQSVKSGVDHAEMLFRCQACQTMSKLLGWAKDVLQQCANGWNRETLMRELNFISKIFHLSQDSKGRKLYQKCGELLEKLKNGTPEPMACRMLLHFIQELELDMPSNSLGEDVGHPISPQEACNKIADVVQEAVRKMEMVAEEKMRLFKRARLALEVCDRELEDKARKVQELQMERHMKKQQVEELESIIRLKQAEADMFQLKANEAKQEAERLQSIVFAKPDKSEQDYSSMYLKRRLEEAEAEKQYIFESIKVQESQRALPGSGSGAGNGDPAQMLNKIQDLLKNVYRMPPKTEGQQTK